MIDLIVGCMFSGKSEELTRRLRRAEIAGLKVVAFKPFMDNRYDGTKIASHSSITFNARCFEDLDDLFMMILESKEEFGKFPDVVGIDEAQFLSTDAISKIEAFADNGIRVILAGLDMDYKGKPFGPIPQLMAISDNITKLSAICVAKDENGIICGKDATRSYRITSADSGKLIQVGAADSYEARCRKCWGNR